jgi:hypothetical protein
MKGKSELEYRATKANAGVFLNSTVTDDESANACIPAAVAMSDT